MKPLVAIPAQTELDAKNYAVRRRYVTYLARSGALSVIVPASSDPADLTETLARCDGLFLVGGPDVWPELYGAPLPTDEEPYHRLRDESEMVLVREAYRLDMPVLGICRGMQVMNVALGGTLHEDVRAHDAGEHWLADEAEDPIFPAHEAAIVADSLLAKVLGDTAQFPVNSMHHQAIAQLSRGLTTDALGPTVFFPDGHEVPVIEAVHAPDRNFFLGVQWHPEYCLDDAPSMRLAEAFVSACEAYRQRHEQGGDL